MEPETDISIPGTAYRIAAGRVIDSSDEYGHFECEYDHDDGDVTHHFELSGRLVFKADIDGLFIIGVNFSRAEAETVDIDGIGLINDFTTADLEHFIAR